MRKIKYCRCELKVSTQKRNTAAVLHRDKSKRHLNSNKPAELYCLESFLLHHIHFLLFSSKTIMPPWKSSKTCHLHCEEQCVGVRLCLILHVCARVGNRARAHFSRQLTLASLLPDTPSVWPLSQQALWYYLTVGKWKSYVYTHLNRGHETTSRPGYTYKHLTLIVRVLQRKHFANSVVVTEHLSHLFLCCWSLTRGLSAVLRRL